MEFIANGGKQVHIEVDGQSYARHAIKTHFVKIGEDYISLIERYVKPDYQEGDLLSISEKIIALCQKRIVYKKDMKLSRMAKFLSRFASSSDAGIGVDSPWKMQFAINHCGILKVLWAAILAGIGKLFGKKGIFYDIVGQEITGLDGFYDHVFPEYGDYGIRIPDNSPRVCNEIYEKTGVMAMIVDANDLSVEILGRADVVPFPEHQLISLIADNPAGQSDELTPFILIRRVELAAPEAGEEAADAEPADKAKPHGGAEAAQQQGFRGAEPVPAEAEAIPADAENNAEDAVNL